MLQAVRDLLPFFVAFFLLDALRHLRASACLLVTRFPAGSRLMGAGLRLGALWPADREFLLSELPIPLTARAVYLPRASDVTGSALFDRRSFDRLPFEELSSLGTEHQKLLVGGLVRLKLPSVGHARALEQILRELRDLPEIERADRLQEVLDRSLSLAAVAEHRRAAEAAVARLTRLCWLLFAGFFVALPLAAYSPPVAPALGWLLLSVAGLHLTVLAAAGRAARTLGPSSSPGARGVLWGAALFPPTVVRLASSLLRDTFCRFDHLAVAAVLLPQQILLLRAARELHCARFAAEDEDDRSWRDYWQRRLKAVEKLLEEAGSSVEEALASPSRRDPSADAYCPLCAGEYRQPADSCEGCRMRLVPFDAAL